MAETEGYTYRVLCEKPSVDGEAMTAHRRLIDLGLYPARTPVEAIEAAVEDARNAGLIAAHGETGRCMAVPFSRWHEASATVTLEPRVQVALVDAPEVVADDDITADPR